MNSPPLVFIIILNWNGWRDTIRCIHSCQRLHYANFRLVVVDNNSSDGSEAILRRYFADIELLQSGANLGFSGGNNIGIRYAIERGADYIWLLNNDAVADAEALTELVKVASDGKVGIAGSKIYFVDSPNTIWFAGGRIHWLTGYGSHCGYLQNDSGQFDEIREVDYITGCSLLLATTVIAIVGSLADEFFLYCEDVDWSQRIHRHGYKIVYVPRSLVWHRVSRSTGKQSPRYYYYLVRNSLLFLQHNKPSILLPATVRKFAEVLALYWRGDKAGARASLRGIFDFLRQRFGP